MLIRSVVLAAGSEFVDVQTVDGRIADVSAAQPGSRPIEGDVLDGRGAALLPSFVDNHLHLTQWAASLTRIDVSGADSAVDLVDILARSNERHGTGILRAQGFRDALWPDAPHKDVLQNALPGRRAAVTSMDLHTLWLSPALLAELGIDHPTGVLRDHDCMEGLQALDKLDDTDAGDRDALAATAELARRGITAITDFEYADNRAVWTRRSQVAAPSVDVDFAVWSPWLEHELVLGASTGARVGDNIRLGPLKVMFDGSLNTRTACCHDPYPGGTSSGLLLETPEGLVEVMRRAFDGGIRPAIHAIGDRANSLALDAFETVGGGGRIEHAQQLMPADIVRFAAAGVAASVQPQHAMSDRDVADELWSGRSSIGYPYLSLHRAGARLLFGSDAPVSPPAPLDAVADAVWRTDDERPAWQPEEALPLTVALAAACGGRRSIATGDPADLVLLAEHPALLGNRDVREVPVVGTIRSGVATFVGSRK
ncbi:amidohydrolase family protein [Rhodococcus sp. G-MC3]|uniref:amidohydrolase n=1 Tax=Rhodococcus sp. G-MC3 TaxID=3046209 RepID=UPI0024BB21C8|nr:amidohydrolase family protein [Rhodococcus sp. G-MC3]MDJ0392789.1 amidohydrolase family protein [Rhodococcus sp. G-MC3]